MIATLYSRDRTGNIIFWRVSVHSADKFAKIILTYGRVRGTPISKTIDIRSGKNIGKSNETTPYEQAILQASSMYTTKIKEGYIDAKTISEPIIKDKDTFEVDISLLDRVIPKFPTDALDRSKPMKAQPYYKDKEQTKIRIKFPCVGQPKINGVRAIIDNLENESKTLFSMNNKVYIRSKTGMTYPLMNHITKEFTSIFPDGLDFVLDGELWFPDAKYLGEVTHAVRTNSANTKNIKFYVFDVAEPNMNQTHRLQMINNVIPDDTSHIVKLPSIWINNDEEAQQFVDDCIASGYEGAVFRDPSAYYEFGRRPSSMVKLKRTRQNEYPIVDIVPEVKDPDKGLFVCITEEGKPFTVTPIENHEKRKEIMANPDAYIGKKITLTFYEYTKNGIPFHITETTIRDYE